MASINISYSNYSTEDTTIESISLPLFPSTTLIASITEDGKMEMTMKDDHTEDIELSGTLTYDELSQLIRCLNTIRKQIKG